MMVEFYQTSIIAFTCYAGIFALIASVTCRIYEAFLGPLSKFPGPRIRALSGIPNIRTVFTGQEGIDYPELHAKYGPVVRVGPHQLSYAGGSQAFKDVYGSKTPLQKDWLFYGQPINKVDSLITANDIDHARQRKVLSHGFSDRSIKDLEPTLKQWTAKMREKLALHADSGTSADMLKYFNLTTLDIMGDVIFGQGLDMLETSEYSDWVTAIFGGVKIAAQFRAIRSLNWLCNFMLVHYVFNSKVAREKQQEHFDYSKNRMNLRLDRMPSRMDIWSRIFEKTPLGSKQGLTIEEYHSTADLFLIAGTETTASALSGTMFHLLKNRECLRNLTQELRSTFSSPEEMTMESLAQLKYLHAVINESLRMYPPAPIAFPRRTPRGGAQLLGEWIPPDTVVGVHHLSTYRSSEHFSNAREFHPERWLQDPTYKDDHLDVLEPFSVGPRNCIGKSLAWFQMRLIIATTVLCFDLTLCEESVNWQEQKIFNMWEKKPLMCKLISAEA